MPVYSLSITYVGPGDYEWVIVELLQTQFIHHLVSQKPYASYEDALAEGIKALARLDGQPLPTGAPNVTQVRSAPDDSIEIPSFEARWGRLGRAEDRGG